MSLIKRHMPFYENVVLARQGIWRPLGTFGEDYPFDRKFFSALAKSYDPLNVHAATIDCGHTYAPWEKALGIVSRLAVETDRGDAVLVGDVANVDWQLAGEIDNGAWPTRSIEWNDAQLYARIFDTSPERFQFYGFDTYLKKLAVIGQVPAAAAGLGPWPDHRILAEQDEQPVEDSRPYVLPMAASIADLPTLKAFNPTAGSGSIPIQSKEAAVDDEEDTEPTVINNSPPPESSGEPTTLQAAQNRITELEAQLAQGTTPAGGGDELSALRAAQDRIGQLEQRLAQRETRDRETQIEARITARMAAGTLTAAQAESYREIANRTLDAVGVRLAAGQNIDFAAADTPLLDLVDKLLANQPPIPMGAQGRQDPGRPQAASVATAGLSAGQAQVIEALVKAGKHEEAEALAAGRLDAYGGNKE